MRTLVKHVWEHKKYQLWYIKDKYKFIPLISVVQFLCLDN